MDETQRLIEGAGVVEFYIRKEFSLASLHIGHFQWNAVHGGGLFLNFPYQLFSVVIDDWQSKAELVDTDYILGFLENGKRYDPVLVPKIHRLVNAYAEHLAAKKDKRSGFVAYG